ncbi:MAG: histidine phosphatase family protein [Alphaproteobacteria bacterium]
MADLHAASRGRKRLFLMRHGEVAYYTPDGKPVPDFDKVGLTPNGEAQARAIGELLAEAEIDLAGHTPLPRTRATLEAVLGERAAPVELFEDMREAGHGSFLTNQQDMLDRFVYGLDHAGTPGAVLGIDGEHLADVYERVANTVEALFRRPGWRSALIVGHGIANRAALAWACGAGLHGLAGFEQDYGCLNVIDADVEDGEIRRRLLRLVNFTAYSPAKHGITLTTMEQAVAGRFAGDAS